MRVALLSFNARVGDGIGGVVARLVAFFAARAADVGVFLEDRSRLHPLVAPRCRDVDPDRPAGPAWDFLRSADLVVAEYGLSYRLAWLLPVLARGPARILFDYQGVTPAGLWGPTNHEVCERGVRDSRLVWCADAALVHSDFTGRELREATGYPAARIHRTGLPVDVNRFRPGRPARDLKRQLRLDGRPLLLYVGRVAPNKRLPVLVEALGQLCDGRPPVHLAVVGDAGDVYRTEMRRCLDEAARVGVLDRVHFLGRLSDERLVDAYRSADAFVMPSRHEGFCLPVVEAMACGLPVVAARAGALPETVGDAGLFFAPDDAGELAGRLRELLGPAGNGSPLAEELRQEGPHRAADFAIDRWAGQLGGLIETVMDGPARPVAPAWELRPRADRRAASAGSGTLLAAVDVLNVGAHVLPSKGPGRTRLRWRVVDEAGVAGAGGETPLPDIVLPGGRATARVAVPVPSAPGGYRVGFFLSGDSEEASGSLPEAWIELDVRADAPSAGPAPFIERVQSALAQADGFKQLPDDYADVTEGRFAGWKRWLKRKLLGNFKTAYVDVLSRRQTEFNRQLLAVVHELAETVAQGSPDSPSHEPEARAKYKTSLPLQAFVPAAAAGCRPAAEVTRDGPESLLQLVLGRLAQSQRRCAELEGRLARLEARVRARTKAEGRV